MAVTVLARPHAGAQLAAPVVPLGVLIGALVAPALDLLRVVQPSMALREVATVAAGAAAALMVLMWARSPRTAWLAAASLAAIASLAMRLVGAELGAGLSLLALLGLGVGGAFSAPSSELESMMSAHGDVDLDGDADVVGEMDLAGDVDLVGAVAGVNPASPDDTGAAGPHPTPDYQQPPRAA